MQITACTSFSIAISNEGRQRQLELTSFAEPRRPRARIRSNRCCNDQKLRSLGHDGLRVVS